MRPTLRTPQSFLYLIHYQEINTFASSVIMSFTYTAHELPPDPSVAVTLIERYRSLRLTALHESPARFTGDYAHESDYTESDWMALLTDPTNHHMICVAHGPEINVRTRDSGVWVGMLTVRGPLSKTRFEFAGREGPDLGPDEQETRWGAFGLYLRPAHRVQAALTKLREALFTFVRAFTDEELPVTVRANGMEKDKHARMCGIVMHGPGEERVRMLYEAWGGYEVGMMTMREYHAFVWGKVLQHPIRGQESIDEKVMTAYELIVSC